MTRDFTLEQYARLCDAFFDNGYEPLTVQDFLLRGQPNKKVVVLRHDVDRSPDSAVRMAEMEARCGIRSTYYVRKTRGTFKSSFLMQLSQFKHEIGYHYEVMAKMRGDVKKASLLFAQELEQFRLIVPVKTVSMHGSPLWPWNNLDLWQEINLKDFGLVGDASLSIDSSDLYYLTDTGRSWGESKYNIRDRIKSNQLQPDIHGTEDLITFLANADNPIILNSHPNRWPDNILGYSLSATTDWLINRVKWLVSRAYQYRK